MTKEQENYAVAKYGDKSTLEQVAKMKNITYDYFVERIWLDKPTVKYGSFLICPCGSHYRQHDKLCYCTRKNCYRYSHPVEMHIAKVAFLEDEVEVTEIDKPAGNAAIFNRGGLVKVIKRDGKSV